jgi:ABC-2 type transport system ATP-binding protein/lipopolysaccharide transport system ATP-binding protein
VDRVQVEQLGKVYALGERATLREHLVDRVRHHGSVPAELLWSLRDVSFTLADGEALGILGRNGAGKSTLLKLLMRITTPSEGLVRTRGRVAALLEVGTGFHPELTGRENVFLNAAVLGMSRADTLARFDEIVAFAGTERFLDTPVKRYSSGMYLRLAFAVAAHLEPDILIVDEVLAVGDAEFQRKCLTRMSSAEREGRTVIFVSHDLASLSQLCHRSLWLESGQVRDDGPTDQIIRDYLSSGVVSRPVNGVGAGEKRGPVRLSGVRVCGPTGDAYGAIMAGDAVQIAVEFEVVDEQLGLDLAVYITNRRGVRIVDELLSDSISDRFRPGVHEVVMDLPPVLNVGEHRVGIWLGTTWVDLVDEPSAAAFEVVGDDRKRLDRVVVLNLPFRHVKDVRGQ